MHKRKEARKRNARTRRTCGTEEAPAERSK